MISPKQIQFEFVNKLAELLDRIRTDYDINGLHAEIISIVVYGQEYYMLPRMNKFIKTAVYLAILFDNEYFTRYADCITYVYNELKNASDLEVVKGGSTKWLSENRRFEELNPQLAAEQAFGVINLIGGLYIVNVLQTSFIVSIVMGCLKGNYNYDYYLGARLFRYLDSGFMGALMCINPVDSLICIENYQLACKRIQVLINTKGIRAKVKEFLKTTWNDRQSHGSSSVFDSSFTY